MEGPDRFIVWTIGTGLGGTALWYADRHWVIFDLVWWLWFVIAGIVMFVLTMTPLGAKY